MPAYDITARVGSWIADVIDADTQAGEEVGYTVTALTHPGRDAITWTFILTMAPPVLGGNHLAASATVLANVPSQDGVRHFTATSLGKLRAQFEQAKRGRAAAGNGHAKRQP